MDPLEELERMAFNAESCDLFDVDTESNSDEIHRWEELFQYTQAEAIEKIQQQRYDLSRVVISDDHWHLIKEQVEAEGFDRKSYEHRLQISRLPPTQCHLPDAAQRNEAKSQAVEPASFVFKLEGPLSTPQDVQRILGTTAALDIRHGVGEDGEVSFCRIDSSAKLAIEAELAQKRIFSRLTFIQESQARKELSQVSAYPTLGVVTTLPHHRPQNNEHVFYPTQDQYPVWYFFYGTLADPAGLSEQFGVPIESLSEMKPATISGGTVKTWSGKYRALVDGPSSATVDGVAYELQSPEQEQSLRVYETSAYEIVRCVIFMEGAEQGVEGCTFRFIGRL